MRRMPIIAERELTPLVLNPPPNITRVVDNDSFEKLIDFLERTPEFGFDSETTPTKDYFWRRVRTMQFGNNTEQYVIDLRALCDRSGETLYNCQGNYGANLHLAPGLQNLLNKLAKYLVSDKWIKVGVNLAFEYECLYWLLGIRAYGWYDCMMAEKCIYAGLGGHASLKNYDFYSMESLMERYFGKTIDKTLQMSFNLDDEISDAQYEYAALDTRTPIGIKLLQSVIASGETPASLKAHGKPKLADYLYYLDSIILGDNLHEIIEIENEAIGSFVDMHLHGERIATEKWLERVQKSKDKYKLNLQYLDVIFLPIVGSKLEAIDENIITKLEAEWKALGSTPTDEEVKMKAQLSQMKRDRKKNLNEISDIDIAELEIKLSQWEQARKAQKDILKAQCGDLKKKRTKIKNLAADCEGEALINYGSDAQLLKVLKENFPKLEKLENLDDETLEKFEKIPVMKLIREYHGLSKQIGTYGDAWAQTWTTHPCKEEGWLHPGDGRLHCEFNQYDAGTGRSSSSKPNGQNLPQDKEVRSCFVADPPNEDVRVSDCCEDNTSYEPNAFGEFNFYCQKCGNECTTHAEENVLVTADMSGAELRIIADDANDPVWINAFRRKEDVHSVGTELLYEIEWPKYALEDCAYFKTHTAESVAKNTLCTVGDPQRQKCKCEKHKELRDNNKSTNFLLAYGGGPNKLAKEIKQTVKHAKELMALHEAKNPRIWAYLKNSGDEAARKFKAFDLFGRRRLLPEPTQARAIENCKEWNEKDLRLKDEDTEKNVNTFITIKGRKPTQLEMFDLSHRQPTANEISRSWFQMTSRITRQGKNHRIQATNATIAKKAMGSGYDQNGIPFLWHTLPQYRATLIKFVHDELVVQCPKRYAQKVADLIGDAFKRAAAMKMKRVVMEFDYNIAAYWKK
jgi:DNA polymerase I-like protein with 3'-5' exonuclease and polymerase domains